MSERGQSEVLGYVLVFSVVVLTVALVTVSGQAALAEARDTQQTGNLEAGFEVLAANVDDVVRGGVPSRATELDLSGGRLSLGSPVAVTVRAEYASNGSLAFEDAVATRPIVYRAESGAELVYANGAVIIEGKEGGVAMLREPRALFSPERAVVPIINTTLDRRQLRGRADSVDRESRVLVRAERRERGVLNSTDSSVDLTVDIDSPRADAWREYLGAAGFTCSSTGSGITCDGYTTDAATVVRTRVAISLE
jgi:hypothetical protein